MTEKKGKTIKVVEKKKKEKILKKTNTKGALGWILFTILVLGIAVCFFWPKASEVKQNANQQVTAPLPLKAQEAVPVAAVAPTAQVAPVAQTAPVADECQKTMMKVGTLFVDEVVAKKSTTELAEVDKQHVKKSKVDKQHVKKSKVYEQYVKNQHVEKSEVDHMYYVKQAEVDKIVVEKAANVGKKSEKSAPCKDCSSGNIWDPRDHPRQPLPGQVSRRIY